MRTGENEQRKGTHTGMLNLMSKLAMSSHRLVIQMLMFNSLFNPDFQFGLKKRDYLLLLYHTRFTGTETQLQLHYLRFLRARPLGLGLLLLLLLGLERHHAKFSGVICIDQPINRVSVSTLSGLPVVLKCLRLVNRMGSAIRTAVRFVLLRNSVWRCVVVC